MEANKDEYFVDGFLIKHFNIFPLYFNKDNLFYEQKVFLIFLTGCIPSIKDWSSEIEYKKKRLDILNLTVKDIHINQETIDMAKIHGKNISVIEKEELISEKKKRIKSLNDKYGIEETEDEIIVERSETEKKLNEREKLWKILIGHGLIKNG